MICRICESEFKKSHFNQKLCSDNCKKESRRQTIKNYKLSEKGVESENRWRKSATRKEAQKKYKASEKEKCLARNRSNLYSLTRFGELKNWFSKEKSKGCKSCGTFENLSVDHVIPFHISNDNTVKNLQVLCVSCNGKKGGRQWQN